MKKSSPILTTAIVFSALLIGCGGEETGITGSQCDRIDCNFDELTCHLYKDPTPAYKLFYKRIFEGGEGFEYAAIIVINLDGLDDYNGLVVEGDDFTNRVLLYRPGVGEQWPEYDDGKLEISTGGDTQGQQLKGKASFRFNNGFFASAYFDCTLESPIQE